MAAVEGAKEQFLSILNGLKGNDVLEFIDWVKDSFDSKPPEERDTAEADANIDAIVEDLKATLPPSSVLPSEQILWPASGPDSDCPQESTIHVDSFLLPTDDDVDAALAAQGLSRNFCTRCNSRNVRPLTFISHSSSYAQLKFVFTKLLPDLSGKTLLDLGSRLGPVLYSAFFLSSAKEIVGIEMNSDMCAIQQQVVAKYAMSDRVRIRCANILDCEEMLQAADVIFINHAFQFFQNLEAQSRIWTLLRKCRRKGQVIVSMPSLHTMCSHVGLPFEIEGGLEKMDTRILAKEFAGENDDLLEDLSDIHVYQVG